jgi:hypothetical protein
LQLWINRSDEHVGGLFRGSKHVPAGVYLSNPEKTHGQQDIAGALGLRPAEFAIRLARLEHSGYVRLVWPTYEDHRHRRRPYPPETAPVVQVTFVTEAGLVVIGELPDPQAQLISGFEAAIEAIKYDRSLTDREKRQKINWLQEGTVIARTLSMDAIKAILAGAIL